MSKSELKDTSNKSNSALMICVVIIAILAIACGVFACLYVKELNHKTNTSDNCNSSENSSNNDSNKTVESKKTDYASYAGTYDSIDGDTPAGYEAYITLNSDGTYERNQNSCSAMTTLVGKYSVSKSGSDTIISFETTQIKDGLEITAQNDYQFKFEDNKLYIIDETNTYAYYDCSNSRTFQKR